MNEIGIGLSVISIVVVGIMLGYVAMVILYTFGKELLQEIFKYESDGILVNISFAILVIMAIALILFIIGKMYQFIA